VCIIIIFNLRSYWSPLILIRNFTSPLFCEHELAKGCSMADLNWFVIKDFAICPKNTTFQSMCQNDIKFFYFIKGIVEILWGSVIETNCDSVVFFDFNIVKNLIFYLLLYICLNYAVMITLFVLVHKYVKRRLIKTFFN